MEVFSSWYLLIHLLPMHIDWPTKASGYTLSARQILHCQPPFGRRITRRIFSGVEMPPHLTKAATISTTTGRGLIYTIFSLHCDGEMRPTAASPSAQRCSFIT